MSFGIYKQGQGYWTRVMSAIGFGTLGVATAAWLSNQVALFVQDDAAATTVKGAVMLAFGLLAGFTIYWLVGVKRRTVDFFIATEGEMRKVHWSTRREIQGSTWVVIGVSVIITVVLFSSDLLFALFFRWIDVLETGG